MRKRVSDFDIIFNTAPYKIFSETVLNEVGKDCLIIDLASKPGGIDFEYADKIGVKYIWALGLPGKVASKSAAKYMMNILM